MLDAAKYWYQMRNLVVLVVVMVMGMGISGCGVLKRSASGQDIAGEWDLISLDGKAVSVSGEQRPYMGFDLREGMVSGSTGCNRMMGAVTVDRKLGILSFGPISGTRMACPDMSLEQALFSAMEKVRSYAFHPDGSLALLDETGGELMVLRRR